MIPQFPPHELIEPGHSPRPSPRAESADVITPQIKGEIRRGRDYVRVVITVAATVTAEAFGTAWRAFRPSRGRPYQGLG